MGLDGVVQKGPFITGSSIQIQELNESLSPNGISFNVTTEDNFGSFTLESEVSTDFIEIISTGFYFNEVSGNNTDIALVLRAVSPVSDSLRCNINILTTLAKKRIVYLINEEGKSFIEAKQQAQNELLDIFSIHETEVEDFEKMDISQNRVSDAILLAISVVLQGSNSVSDLSLLISTIIEDIKEDGILNDVGAKLDIYNNAKNLNLPAVRSNIETRYDDLGLTLTVPDFEKYVNDMWKKQCTIISPLNDQTFNYNDSMNVNIDDFASYINVINTKYYLDGNLIFDDNDYPYSNNYKLKDLDFGDHSLKAIATDDSSNVYSDSINIVVNTPDQFTLISPIADSYFNTNDTVRIEISSNPDFIKVTSAKYFLKDSLLTEILSDPFSHNLVLSDPFKIGKLFIKAIITDETGRSTADSVLIDINGMVYLQGSTYEMGDNFIEGWSEERPVHTVTLSDFFIGMREVTQKEWASVMGSNPASAYGVGDNYPVYNVSWYSIMKYCNLRSMSEGLTPVYTISSSTDPADWGTVPTSSNSTWNAAICNWSANGYRLPSEAEWEYAARGGLSGQRFTNGATISHSTNGATQANYFASPSSFSYDVSPTAQYHPDYNEKSSPVGSFPPNGYGLYDMTGNLGEWCWDWFSDSYYSNSPAINPTGPTTGYFRIMRGGYWSITANCCRVATRTGVHPENNGYVIGFRLSRTP